MNISHIALIVSDIDKSLRFYEEVLGFKIKSRAFRAERNSWKVNITNGSVELEMFTFPGAPKRPSYPEAMGLRHLAFQVHDIKTCHEDIKKKVLKVEEIRLDPETGKNFFFFSDPDDLPLEIYEI